jgi:hypothetical protein
MNTTTRQYEPAVRQKNNLIAAATSLAAGIFSLYILEAILTFSSPSWVDRLGTTLRRGPSVVDETIRMRASHSPAFPFLQPDTYLDTADQSLISVDGTRTIPLSGGINALTILCNESGTTIGYRSDSLGFRNPPDVWDSIHPDAALIGDSFAHGFCRPESETVASKIRTSGVRVVNVGLTGAGPLAELGVLREFLSHAKPKRVYWLFYEGNDLIDLTSERNTFLIEYLEPAHSQHLFERRHQVDSAIKEFSTALLAKRRLPTMADKAWSFLILRKLRTATGLYRQPSQPPTDEKQEIELLDQVLAQASTEVNDWGGELRIVYLPERRRFNKRTAPVTGENHDPLVVEQRVKSIAQRRGIPFVDVATIFASQPEPTKLWNSRRYHYNAQGYALVAKAIIDDLKKP